MSFNESIVEDAALEWFLLRQGYGGELGYAVGHGAAFAQPRLPVPFLAPSKPASERDFASEVVLVGRLCESVRRLNTATLFRTLATLLPKSLSGKIKVYNSTNLYRSIT